MPAAERELTFSEYEALTDLTPIATHILRQYLAGDLTADDIRAYIEAERPLQSTSTSAHELLMVELDRQIAWCDQILQREPKNIPANVPPPPPAITGVRPLTECACGRSLLPGMRFCDACGQPVSYTGKTERLG